MCVYPITPCVRTAMSLCDRAYGHGTLVERLLSFPAPCFLSPEPNRSMGDRGCGSQGGRDDDDDGSEVTLRGGKQAREGGNYGKQAEMSIHTYHHIHMHTLRSVRTNSRPRLPLFSSPPWVLDSTNSACAKTTRRSRLLSSSGPSSDNVPSLPSGAGDESRHPIKPSTQIELGSLRLVHQGCARYDQCPTS